MRKLVTFAELHDGSPTSGGEPVEFPKSEAPSLGGRSGCPSTPPNSPGKPSFEAVSGETSTAKGTSLPGRSGPNASANTSSATSTSTCEPSTSGVTTTAAASNADSRTPSDPPACARESTYRTRPSLGAASTDPTSGRDNCVLS